MKTLIAIKTKNFNTNNAWGFGGAIGTETTYDNGTICRKGIACYRHAGTSRFERWYKIENGERTEITKKEAYNI